MNPRTRPFNLGEPGPVARSPRASSGRRAGLWTAPFTVTLLTVALLSAGPTTVANAMSAPEPGAAGIGDPYFPLDGNGGYDALHYWVTLKVDTAANRIEGTAVMDARATTSLSRFDLDLHGLTISSITVNGRPAAWSRDGQEVIIRPRTPLTQSTEFRTVVRYAGTPGVVQTPDGYDNGWFWTSDGASAVGEPPGASTWIPVNDHPRDKALFDISVTVPDGKAAISNGLLTGKPKSVGGWTTWSWHNRHPIASYLILLSVGTYDVRYSTTASGLPIIDAVDPAIGGIADAALAREAEVISTLEKSFGPYPFEAAGGVVDQLNVGWALETQTRSFYSQDFFTGSPDDAWVVAHETAHAWFGDSVSLCKWQDIWLNEGFATYAEWLWAEHEGWYTPAQVMGWDLQNTTADDPLWALDISNPGPVPLFDHAVYERGALVLQALREQVGDVAFFKILKAWARDHRDANATTGQFVELAERISKQDLTVLFDTWLFGAGKPSGRPGVMSPATAPAAKVTSQHVASSTAVPAWARTRAGRSVRAVQR
jgi:aminopeptidase N